MVLFELLALGAIGFGVRRHMKKKRARKLQQKYGGPPPDYYPPPPQRDYSRSDYEPGYNKPSYAQEALPHSQYYERPAPGYGEAADVVPYRQDGPAGTEMDKGARERWRDPGPTNSYDGGYSGSYAGGHSKSYAGGYDGKTHFE
jgi:hypothetical protein